MIGSGVLVVVSRCSAVVTTDVVRLDSREVHVPGPHDATSCSRTVDAACRRQPQANPTALDQISRVTPIWAVPGTTLNRIASAKRHSAL
jgi:hypothetical protein